MTAAETLFAFLIRGLNQGLAFSQWAALAYLAAHESGDRRDVLSALGYNVSSSNAAVILGSLVKLGFASHSLVSSSGPGATRPKHVYTITPKGLRALGLPSKV